MAFAGLIFIGLLFGVMLSAIVVGFIVVRSGGPLKESLFGDASRAPSFASPPPGPELSPEADKRHKSLLEELRISQKLIDKGRMERDQHDKAVKEVQAELLVVRNQLAERNLRIQALEASLAEASLRVDSLADQLGERTEMLSTVSLQLKDARTEIDVSESGSSLTTSQIGQLQRERDELAALVDQLRPRRAASQPFS